MRSPRRPCRRPGSGDRPPTRAARRRRDTPARRPSGANVQQSAASPFTSERISSTSRSITTSTRRSLVSASPALSSACCSASRRSLSRSSRLVSIAIAASSATASASEISDRVQLPGSARCRPSTPITRSNATIGVASDGADAAIGQLADVAERRVVQLGRLEHVTDRDRAALAGRQVDDREAACVAERPRARAPPTPRAPASARRARRGG